MTGTTLSKPFLSVRKRHSGVAFVMMESGSKVNLLTGTAIAEFHDMVDRLSKDDDIKAVVIISGKPDNFVSGADLHEIGGHHAVVVE